MTTKKLNDSVFFWFDAGSIMCMYIDLVLETILDMMFASYKIALFQIVPIKFVKKIPIHTRREFTNV